MNNNDLKPEQKARVEIDNKLAESWWAVVEREERSDYFTSYAVREFIVKESKRPDYLLFLNGKAIGVVEAKREENDLKEEVEAQADRYTKLLPEWVAQYKMFDNLPISYITNGKIIKFKDLRKADSKYVEVKNFHTPKELSDMLGLTERYSGLPTLADKDLMGFMHENAIKDFWFDNTLYNHQIKAIHNIDYAFLNGKRRALLYLATGAGKTFTACNLCYRYLEFTNVKRILFLADRNNLCKQANDEFSAFGIPRTGETFVSKFTVDRLKSNDPLETANVEICTIQRLFSYLSGKKINDNNSDKEDQEQDEKLEKGETGNKVILPDNPKLPKDFFDLIIVDECHRSIYSDWGAVLDYFENANIIGLTATPTETTVNYFGGAPVYTFTYNDSVKENINCYPKIYRIKTDVTVNGGTIKAGEKFDEANKKTGEKTKRHYFADDKEYKSNQLDVDVVNPTQIELILATYRDTLYSTTFPEREKSYLYIPKTLIFAKNEGHAKDIVEIAKIVFKEKVKEELPPNENIDEYMDKYVQRITYSCENSEGLINEFRTSKKFRIAVTVTLVATGTDVRPLETVFFMRDVRSEVLYEQMKGRGCRKIKIDELMKVTPNAKGKDYFYMIDAIGVSEHEKTMPKGSSGGGGGGSGFSLKELIDHLSSGDISDDILEAFAIKLSRIAKKMDAEMKDDLLTDYNFDIEAVSDKIYSAVNNESLPEFKNSADANTERKDLVKAITTSPALIKRLIDIAPGYEIRLKPGEDHVIYQGHALEEAKKATDEFEDFLNHKMDIIRAIKMIRDGNTSMLSNNDLSDLIKKLSHENAYFKPELLWNYYQWLRNGESPEDLTKAKKERTVIPLEEKNDVDDIAKIKAVTNIIQLVRFALKKSEKLQSFCVGYNQRFNLWLGHEQQNNYNFTKEQKEFLRIVAQRICLNGAIDIDWLREENEVDIVRELKNIYGDFDSAGNELEALNKFILNVA